MAEKIKWGIVSTGHIAHRLAGALQHLPHAEIHAVASRNISSAEKFAEEYGIPNAFGSYSAMAEDSEVDVVYIATPHVFHLDNSILFMRAGKSVLCEKAFAINAREAEEMIRVAREEHVFLMEAMLTRHVPLIKKIQNWIKEGLIGEVRMVKASRCARGQFDPAQRHLNPDLGGGSLLDVGVYVISFASMIFQKSPEHVAGFAHIGEYGSDEQGAAILKYDEGEIADLSFALRTNAVNDAYIFGTEGYIKIDEVFAVPTSATLFRNDEVSEIIEETIEGGGFIHEAEEVMRCMREGLKESPRMPLSESLQIMRIMDQVRAPWGLNYPNDHQ
jgi:predicted dehydrogenase